MSRQTLPQVPYLRSVSVNDHQIQRFEAHFPVPSGMSYNSYVLLDEKIAVLDTMDRFFVEDWLRNLEEELAGRTPDYLVVHHMEPDHSSGIQAAMEKYPNLVLVSSAKAFSMMKQFIGDEYEGRRMVVQEGATLPLGKSTLKFIAAPMVHWPEVLLSYDMTNRVLFSADAFGKFGATDVMEDWDDEARRYYIGIVGKYGMQVQNVLKKAAELEIDAICPLHGPVLTPPLDHFLSLYRAWSSYAPEKKGVTLAYTSVYGHTEEAVLLLKEKLEQAGQTVALWNLAYDDIWGAVADAFRYDRLVLATTTYNMGIFPPMREFLQSLTDRNFQNRTVGLIENGSWAPAAAKGMLDCLSAAKGLTVLEPVVTLKSALNEESKEKLDLLARAVLKS
ncbi:MAG: FprA family A-type flavoprotein [Clostridia bacterium]|nr:FprA family A-type flavoprotein [Clostridia bacterium]